MSIVLVNSSRDGATAGGSSIATSAQSLTAGNLSVVGFFVDDGQTPSGVPTDTAGNTYLAAGTVQAMSGGAPNLNLYYAYNCLGHATNVITLNLSGSATYRAWVRWQFSGVPTSDPYIAPFKFGTNASGPAMSTASLSHGAGESVICAFGCCFNGDGGVVAGGSGYTFNAFQFDGGVSNLGYADEYHIASADEAPTMTAGTHTDHEPIPWALLAAAFGSQVAGVNTRAGIFAQQSSGQMVGQVWN